jgi:hypothetical protein
MIWRFVPCVASTLLLGATPASAFDLGKEVGNCFSGGCDVIWGINQRIDGGLRSKSESLVGPAKQAFDEAMTQLFNTHLNPFLANLNSDLAARIDQGADRANALVHETENGILALIDHAGDIAERTNGDVQQTVNLVFNEATAFETKVDKDLSSLVADIDCKVNGTYDGLILWFSTLVTSPHPFDACYTTLGYYVTTPASQDYINWYRITKCEYMKDLDQSHTVYDIKANYARLSELARRFSCVAQDPVSTSLLTSDVATYVRNYDLWRIASLQ